MIPKSDDIVLVLVCDNHFCTMLAALLKSIETNQDGKSKILIYIIDDGINQRNREKINQTIVSTKIELIWIPIKLAIPNTITFPQDGSTFPKNVYARLCISYFLPSTVNRAIYLDTDTLVLGNIRDLWNIDLRGMALGAVRDLSETVSSDWGGIPNYSALGIPAETKYFNSGILLIDVQKWRNDNIPEAIIQCIQANIAYASFPDQYGLNVYFANQWHELDPLWNCYSQCDYDAPLIIHFTRMKPIYKGYRFNTAYAARFFEYLRQTPYRQFKPHSMRYRFFIKLLQFFDKKRAKLNWAFIRRS